MQDIRENAQSGTTDPDAVQLSSSSDATCVADAVRRASESLSPQPFSNIWEQGVFGAIFTGNMSDWLSTFDSSLRRLVEPPVLLQMASQTFFRRKGARRDSEVQQVLGESGHWCAADGLQFSLQ